MKNKVRTVMKEFKSGDLKSSSGKKVTNPKQAIAIALSEAGKSKPMKEGGHMKESKEMMKKEVSFMKKKGAPKSMIKHEMKEAGMKHGGKVKKMMDGGMATRMNTRSTTGGSSLNPRSSFLSPRGAMTGGGKPAMPIRTIKKGGEVKKMAGGGLAPGHKSADGVAKKGKTDTKQVAMKKGGAVKKMRYGGKC